MALKKVLSGIAAALLLFAASAHTLGAQTAAELERILALPAVSCGDAAWLVLGAAGDPADSPGEAYRFAAGRGWLPRKAAAETAITLGGLSFLIMRAFNIKGGLMYALFPGPRYACRELQALGLLRGRIYPTSKVSGAECLQLLGETLSHAGDPENERGHDDAFIMD